MKHLKNTNLAETTIVTYLLKLLSVLLVILVIYGGDSYALERSKYKVIVTRPGKNVTTQLRVYAEDMEEARENVALNGLQILSIEPYDPVMAETTMRGANSGDAALYNISISKVGNGEIIPATDTQVQAGDELQLLFRPGPCEKIGKLIYNGAEVTLSGETHTIKDINKDGFIVAIFEDNGGECANNGVYSKDLTEIKKIFFALGEFSSTLSEADIRMIKELPEDKNYVIIGHTDDLKVTPNSKYSNNLDLSIKRAQFLMKLLTNNGINSDNIKIVGLGPSFTAAPNQKEGQPLNRRAVLYERRR
ncbi:MAG: hypothetical protein C0603_08405 [Denitrovibrio sp.]|nr:MAG: hypothetical protein C0603_08405 [Denitrovibrio sp.]